MKIKTLIATTLIVFSFISEGSAQISGTDFSQLSKMDAPKNLLLPINPDKGVYVQLTVPKDFKLVYSNQAQIQADMLELMFGFIPEGERSESWTQSFTAQGFIGQQMEAEPFVTLSLANIEQVVGQGSMDRPEVFFKSHEGFDEGVAQVSYINNGVKEVLFIHAFCGPYNTAVLQMTYRPEQVTSGDEESYKAKFKSAVKLLSKDQLPEDIKAQLN